MNCGQPLVMGSCTLCGHEPDGDAPTPDPKPSQPALLDTKPRRPVPQSTMTPRVPPPVSDEPNMSKSSVIVAVGVALLALSLLASGYLILTVSGLRSKVDDARAASTSVQDRLAIVEGSLSAAQSDEADIHSVLDAQAAADPAAISTRIQPSVYTVSTGTELGSAWVAASDGVTARFVTNYHVIADAWERGVKTVQVFQDQGAQLTGTIQQALPDIDLAEVDVQANIPALKASNATPRAGEAVLVIGSPLGLGGSVTTGAVSALRDVDAINFIQFSAPISPGNSGGPLVNGTGQVIGVTEAKSIAPGAEGIALAIPVNQVCTRLNIC